jgi:hypothetical protein
MTTSAAEVFSERAALLPARQATGVKLYAEDGWIFREHPGKGIECICRYEDANIAVLAEHSVQLLR